jgi:hypothetical protein
MVICAVIIFPFREPWLSVILFIFPAIYDMLPSTKRQTSDYRYQLLKRAIRCAPDFPFNVGKWDIGFLEKRDSFSLMALLRIADQIESSQGKMPELTEDAQRILLNMVLEYRYDWAPEANRRFLSVIQTYRHEIFCPELAREFEVSFPQTLGLGRQVADNRFGIHTPN